MGPPDLEQQSSPSPDASFEFNTVNPLWNVQARADGSSPPLAACGAHINKSLHRDHHACSQAVLTPPDWCCHTCGAVYLSRDGDGTRTVCPVCLTARLGLSNHSLPLQTLSSSWACSICQESNGVAQGGSKERLLVRGPTRANSAALACHTAPKRLMSSRGDDAAELAVATSPGQHTNAPVQQEFAAAAQPFQRCRCCGSSAHATLPISSAFREVNIENGSISRDNPRGSNNVDDVRYPQLSSLIQFQRPVSDTHFKHQDDTAAASSLMSAVIRSSDALLRWHCVLCSMSNVQCSTRCSRCRASRFSMPVSCPSCRYAAPDLTVGDVVMRRKCPRCAHPLHGAVFKQSHSLWTCTCGTVCKMPTCVRCRAPRNIPLEPTNILDRYLHTTGVDSGSGGAADGGYDFGECTNWSCATCFHINKASYRIRVEALNGKLGGVQRTQRRRAYAAIQTSDCDSEIIIGQHSCGSCNEPWHGLTVSGGQAWRCACQHVNAKSASVCEVCGRAKSITSTVTLSFWLPGDWVCPTCHKHNYRRKSMCRCGTTQPQ
jgi:hypothetical protein